MFAGGIGGGGEGVCEVSSSGFAILKAPKLISLLFMATVRRLPSTGTSEGKLSSNER